MDPKKIESQNQAQIITKKTRSKNRRWKFKEEYIFLVVLGVLRIWRSGFGSWWNLIGVRLSRFPGCALVRWGSPWLPVRLWRFLFRANLTGMVPRRPDLGSWHNKIASMKMSDYKKVESSLKKTDGRWSSLIVVLRYGRCSRWPGFFWWSFRVGVCSPLGISAFCSSSFPEARSKGGVLS